MVTEWSAGLPIVTSARFARGYKARAHQGRRPASTHCLHLTCESSSFRIKNADLRATGRTRRVSDKASRVHRGVATARGPKVIVSEGLCRSHVLAQWCDVGACVVTPACACVRSAAFSWSADP